MTPRVLYIAGYSRSGSTLLDMVLNANPDVVSAGELTFLHDDVAQTHRICSCWARYDACSRYRAWLEKRPPSEGAIVRAVEHRGSLRGLKDGTLPAAFTYAYRDYGQSLFDHISATSGARLVVDSSKSARDAAGRPLALSQLAGLDVRILHLSRDPRRTIASYCNSGSNWVAEGHRKPQWLETWRPVLGWTIANRIARGLGRMIEDRLGPGRYLHLRFEDLLSDPVAALDKIGAFADVDLSASAQRIAESRPFEAGHMVGGNRARLTPQTLRVDPPQTIKLPAAHALGLAVVGRGTAKDLGYA